MCVKAPFIWCTRTDKVTGICCSACVCACVCVCVYVFVCMERVSYGAHVLIR